MSFQQGLSGLNTTSKNLEVIGNNIANAGTFGAKASRAEFSDFYAAALNGSTSTGAGIGTQLSSISQQFTQGGITATDNPLDIAISGRGFFQVSDGVSPPRFSRNGQFKVDRDGFVVNNAGMKLLGYTADAGTGQIQPGLAVPIQLPTSGVAPHATTTIGMQYNLDSRDSIKLPAAAPLIDFNDAATYNDAKSQTVYDAKGQPITLTYYFQRASAATSANPTAPDEWNVYITANGVTVGGTPAAPDPLTKITFSADGSVPTATTLGVVNTNTGNIDVTAETDVLTVAASIDVAGSVKAAVGLGTVARAAYPDPTGEGKLVCVDVKAGRALGAPVTLAALKEARAFAGSPLITQGRLSVVPLTAAQWKALLAMGG